VRGARLFGMKTALVRTGKFRPETLEAADAAPDIVASSLAVFPELLEEDLRGGPAR
jgi:ribonucleotide monophosphatase NagD (HAD superfamily)